MTAALARPPPTPRRSVPAPGSSLVAATEAYAAPVRAAVLAVRRCLNDDRIVNAAWADMLASRWREEPLATSAPASLRAAWGLVAMRIVGRSVGALSASASLRDAEAWFLGPLRPPCRMSDAVVELADRKAVRALERIPYDDTLRDLLPYVLDAHGPGSRASVMRAPDTGKARQAKRTGGIFYTPSDVAEYITREAVSPLGLGIEPPSILDPACGSGVFLKAALDLAVVGDPSLDRFDFVERWLHGIDVNPLAVEAACFVLLHECLIADHARQKVAPWSLWHRIRCNLGVADALTFEVFPSDDRTGTLASRRAALDHAWLLPMSEDRPAQQATTLFPQASALGRTFPALAFGADVIVGNPPYAPIGRRADAAALVRRFRSLQGRNVAGANLYPAFLELMWKLARPSHSSSGMVVPLSLAYSSRAQIAAVRRAIMTSGGWWRFAFFDREPHGRFGEEVKIRNTIALRYKDDDETGAATEIETGPLRKWTSRQRSRLFETIDFTPWRGGSIAANIPKFSGDEAGDVFGRLLRHTAHLREMCASVSSCRPEETAGEVRHKCVFVAGTAYNFLNVFRPHRSLPRCRGPWSASKVLALGFATEDAAARAFAILSSRVAYWLWHVTEDGFHVTRTFVLTLPFSDSLLSETQSAALARLGASLWDDVQQQQIVSVNGGRQTVAYRPHASEALRDQIDALLLETLGVAPSFVDWLRGFTRDVVAVDECHKQRRLADVISLTEDAGVSSY